MGFFGRLFGRETDEQRIARAKECIDSGEPDIVPRILMGIEGEEARKPIALARKKIDARESRTAREAARPKPHVEVTEGDPFFEPEPEPEQPKPRLNVAASDDAMMVKATSEGAMSFTFGADGSQKIAWGNDSIVLNQPRSDDDGRKRSTDGLAVARTLIAALVKEDRELRFPAYPFIEAVLLVARAGDKLPRIKDGRRNRLADMCAAAAARDPEKVIALGSKDRTVEDYIAPLVLPLAPATLASLATRNVTVLRALAPPTAKPPRPLSRRSRAIRRARSSARRR